jgi:hypothetical protein
MYVSDVAAAAAGVAPLPSVAVVFPNGDFSQWTQDAARRARTSAGAPFDTRYHLTPHRGKNTLPPPPPPPNRPPA